MKLTSVLLAATISCCLLACDSGDSRLTRKISDIEQKFDSLTFQLSLSDELISALQTQITELQSDMLTVQNVQNRYKTVVFDATESRDYQVLQTTSGQFLVALEEANPYLDGYRLKFTFGNPYSATFKGLEVSVTWGKSFDKFSESQSLTEYPKWQQSLRSKQVTLTQDLEPATWNIVNIVVSPAKSDQLSYVEVSMTTKSVSLRTK